MRDGTRLPLGVLGGGVVSGSDFVSFFFVGVGGCLDYVDIGWTLEWDFGGSWDIMRISSSFLTGKFVCDI